MGGGRLQIISEKNSWPHSQDFSPMILEKTGSFIPPASYISLGEMREESLGNEYNPVELTVEWT